MFTTKKYHLYSAINGYLLDIPHNYGQEPKWRQQSKVYLSILLWHTKKGIYAFANGGRSHGKGSTEVGPFWDDPLVRRGDKMVSLCSTGRNLDESRRSQANFPLFNVGCSSIITIGHLMDEQPTFNWSQP